MNSGCKTYAKIINKILQIISDTLISEEQNIFLEGRSCTDNIFENEEVTEKCRHYNKEIHMTFIDVKESFAGEHFGGDRSPETFNQSVRKLQWWYNIVN